MILHGIIRPPHLSPTRVRIYAQGKYYIISTVDHPPISHDVTMIIVAGVRAWYRELGGNIYIMQGGNKRKEEKGIGVGYGVGVGGEGKGGFFVQLWGVEVGVEGGWCGVVWYGVKSWEEEEEGKKVWLPPTFVFVQGSSGLVGLMVVM